MKSIISIPATLIIVAGAVIFIGTHYIVVTYQGTTTLQKSEFSMTPVFLDIRNWDISDLIYNPNIATIFVEQGKASLLPGGATTKALLQQGEAGLERMEELLNAGISSLDELDEKYDVSGQAKIVADEASKLAEEIDAKFDISGKTKKAEKTIRKWIKN